MCRAIIRILLTLLAVQSCGMAQPLHKWAVRNESRIQITGKSNVARFTCDAERYPGKDTLELHEVAPTARALFSNGAVHIPITQFDCHNAIMTADFRKTLQAKQYPQLTIRFLHLDKFPALRQNCESITGRIEVALAGVVKAFEMTFEIEKKKDGTVRLFGRRNMYFSNFNLIPPQKMLGLVRVEDGLTVEFNMHLQPQR